MMQAQRRLVYRPAGDASETATQAKLEDLCDLHRYLEELVARGGQPGETFTYADVVVTLRRQLRARIATLDPSGIQRTAMERQVGRPPAFPLVPPKGRVPKGPSGVPRIRVLK